MFNKKHLRRNKKINYNFNKKNKNKLIKNN